MPGASSHRFLSMEYAKIVRWSIFPRRRKMRHWFFGISPQCNVVCGQQARKILAAYKSVLAFALDRQRVEADKGFVDEAGMTHDEAAFRQSIQKLLHQRAKI